MVTHASTTIAASPPLRPLCTGVLAGLLLAVVPALLVDGSAIAEEILVPLLQDSYIDRDEPDTNFGGADRLDAHYGIVGRTPEGHAHYVIRNILLQFDPTVIAAIPDDATITSATLGMSLDSADASDRVYMDVAVVNTAWDESTVTWNGLADRYAYPRSPRITSHIGSAGWMQWDVTRIARDWKSGFYDNHGLLLMIYLEAGTAIEDYSRIFVSKERDYARAPRLRIEYETTPPVTDVDLRITNLEINQVVQKLEDIGRPNPRVDNTVSLIDDKPTIVRAYVDIGPATEPARGVTAYLYRVDPAGDERIGPIAPINAVASPDRENRHQSINFRLPEDWLHGSQQFYVEVNPPTLSMRVPETDFTNNRFPADGSFIDANFEGAGRAADIAWTRMNYTWSGWSGPAMARNRVGLRQTADFTGAVFPLPPQNLRYRFWPGGNIDWDQDINTRSGRDFRSELDRIYDLSTTSPKPTFLACFVPEGAYDHVGLSDPPYNTGDGRVVFVNDEDPNLLYRVIFTHELGHNMNSQGHGSLPNARLPDEEFGYDTGDIDRLHRIVMRHYTDASGTRLRLMDFMLGGTSPGLWDGDWAWVTGHTFDLIHDYATTSGFLDDSADAYGEKSAGQPASSTAKKVLRVAGSLKKAGGGEFQPFFQLADRVPNRSKDGGEYSIEFYDNDGSRLSSFQFDVSFGIDNFAGRPVTETSFSFMIPYDTEPRTIVLKHGEKELAKIERSAKIPEVTILSPNTRQTLSGEVTLKWKGTDADNDPLTYAVLYSRDKAQTWIALASNLKDTQFKVKTDELPGSEQAVLRVMVTDGVNTAYDDTDESFIIKGKEPDVAIITPSNDTQCRVGEELVFRGEGYDLEDGVLDAKSLTWTSDRDGPLGEGGTLRLDSLSAGIHLVTLTATDRDGATGRDSRSVLVSPAATILPSSFELAQQTAIEILVVDGDSQKPVPNATVSFHQQQAAAEGVAVTTNSLGLALLKTPPTDSLQLHVSHPDYEPWTKSVPTSADTQRLKVALSKVTPSDTSIMLKVVDAKDGTPIAAAEAIARWETEPLRGAVNATTDSRGEREIRLKRAGDYTILVHAENYQAGGARVEVQAGKRKFVEVSLKRQQPLMIRAVVTDAQTGQPLSDTRVTFRQQNVASVQSGKTGQRGDIQLALAAPGRYAITAERPGYERWSTQQRVDPGTETVAIAMVPSSTPSQPMIKPPSSALVTGYVLAETDKTSSAAGVEGARLLWQSGRLQREVETTRGGRFLIELPPGKYRVLGKASGYQNIDTGVVVQEGMPSVKLRMRRIVSPVLALRVLGQSRTAQATRIAPIANADIQILLGSRTVSRGNTGPEGVYSASLSPGAYRIRVSHDDYEPLSETITVSSAGARRQFLLHTKEMAPELVRLDVRTVTRDAAKLKTIAAVELEILDSNNQVVTSGFSGEDGTFSTRLPAGQYLVRATHQDFAPAQARIQLRQARVDRQIGLAPIAQVHRLNVRVVAQASPGQETPLRGAKVELYRRGEAILSEQTNTAGLCQLTVPDRGSFVLQVSKQGYQIGRTSVSIDHKEEAAEVSLRPLVSPPPTRDFMLQLAIVDQAGKPIPTASVTIRKGSQVIATGLSDKAGRFAKRLGAGNYSIKVQRQDYVPAAEQLVLTKSMSQKIALRPTQQSQSQRGKLTIEVRLRHPDGSQTMPFDAAEVQVLQGKKLVAKGKTAKDGICRPAFSLAPGSYQVKASKTGYASQSINVNLTSGSVRRTMTLNPPGLN